MAGRTFRKPVRDLDAVWQKNAALARVAVETGGFVAAAPLERDFEAGVIEFAWLDGLVPFVDEFAKRTGSGREDLMVEVGRVLGLLHRGWAAEHGEVVAASGPGGCDLLAGLDAIAALQPCLLHGDFGFGNIFGLRDEPGRLAILDPEPAPYLDWPVFAVQTPAWDMAHFMGCLEGVFPWRCYAAYPWRRNGAFREAVLIGYAESTGVRIPAAEMATLTRRLLAVFAAWLRDTGHSITNRTLGMFLGWMSRHHF